MDVKKDWAAHCRWWSDFWNKSWIIASDNTLPPEEREQLNGEAPTGRRQEEDGGALAAQSYNVFRFLMACQSRGRIQTKFNGGIFTQPLGGDTLTHEDERDWARRFTFQNQRLLYWLATGYWPTLPASQFHSLVPSFFLFSPPGFLCSSAG